MGSASGEPAPPPPPYLPPKPFLVLSCPPPLVHMRAKNNTLDTGAYGAHGLSDKSDKIRNDWKTATQYQLLHAVALATLPTFQRTAARTASGVLFSAGITLFSGSVYAYGERDFRTMSVFHVLVVLTYRSLFCVC